MRDELRHFEFDFEAFAFAEDIRRQYPKEEVIQNEEMGSVYHIRVKRPQNIDHMFINNLLLIHDKNPRGNNAQIGNKCSD